VGIISLSLFLIVVIVAGVVVHCLIRTAWPINRSAISRRSECWYKLARWGEFFVKLGRTS
jgi:hypothetical protein